MTLRKILTQKRYRRSDVTESNIYMYVENRQRFLNRITHAIILTYLLFILKENFLSRVLYCDISDFRCDKLRFTKLILIL